MNNKLTRKDIEEMQAEIDHRKLVLRPELLEEVKETRAQGDLSENFEYYAAKRDKNKNESRIRYLENMIRTAKVIDVDSREGVIALFDKVLIYNEKMGKEKEIEIVTTLRQNALLGYVSKESPLGAALIGHKVGDRVLVEVNPTTSYYVEIRKITKGEDNTEIPISGF
jgi:transcription elongation factor GreA